MPRETDDLSKRKIYKENKYGDKRSVRDEYTGERVFKGNKQDAAHRHPIDKVSDTDHITPIKTVNERYSGLTKEQRKKLANNEHNYAITNSKLNRSKGGLENHEYLKREIKNGEGVDLKTSVKMLEKEAESRVAMRTQATVMYSENLVHKITDGNFAEKVSSLNKAGREEALNSAIFASALSVTTNTISVIKGEKNSKEAVTDTVKDVVTATALGYTTGVVMKQLAWEHTEASLFVNGSIQIAKQAVSLANGQISSKEFFEKTAETAAYITAGYIGKSIGGAIGGVLIPIPVVGSYIGQYVGEVVTTMVCSEIINTVRFSKEFEKHNSKFISLCKRAESEIKESRKRLEYIINKENNELIEKVSAGFENIMEGIRNNSFESISNGFSLIGEKFNLTEDELKKGLLTKENIFADTDEEIILE